MAYYVIHTLSRTMRFKAIADARAYAVRHINGNPLATVDILKVGKDENTTLAGTVYYGRLSKQYRWEYQDRTKKVTRYIPPTYISVPIYENGKIKRGY